MKIKNEILLTCCFFYSVSASALPKFEYHIDGFLTAGFGVLSSHQIFSQQINQLTVLDQISIGQPPQYNTVVLKPEIINYNSKIDFQQAGVIGLNGRVDINDKYSLVLQITALGENEFNPNVEWGFIEYRFNEHLDFRFGRLRLPLYMLSDTLEVGYTYPWVTPPIEIYAQIPFTNYSGAEIVYDTTLLDQNLRASLYYGSEASAYTALAYPQTLRLRQALGGYIEYGNEDVKARLSYSEGNLTLYPVSSYQTTIQSYAAIFQPTVVSDFDITDVKAYFGSIGLEYNKNNVLILAELIKKGANTIAVPEVRAWYTTLGYRIDKWLPFIGYSEEITLHKSNLIYTGAFGAAVNPLTTLLNQDQKTFNLGLRWNVLEGTDLKLQVDRIKPANGTNGLFTNAPPDEAAYLFRGTLDVVF